MLTMTLDFMTIEYEDVNNDVRLYDDRIPRC